MFLDERGRRGLLVRALGVFGALVSAGALMLLVTGVLAFMHLSPVRVGGAGGLPARADVQQQSGPRRPPGYRATHRSSVRLAALARGERAEPIRLEPVRAAKRLSSTE